MQLEKVANFYQELVNSEHFSKDLQNKLQMINDKEKYKVFIKDEILPLAKTMGYNFSMDDILTYEHEKLQQLNEKELESVTGGKWTKNLTTSFISALAIVGGTYALQVMNFTHAAGSECETTSEPTVKISSESIDTNKSVTQHDGKQAQDILADQAGTKSTVAATSSDQKATSATETIKSQVNFSESGTSVANNVEQQTTLLQKRVQEVAAEKETTRKTDEICLQYFMTEYKITTNNVNKLIEAPWPSIAYPFSASRDGYTTPLILSVKNQNVAAIKKLLQMGASVDAKDSHGNTALHWAAQSKNEEALEAVEILSEFATIDEKGEEACTPLHYAVMTGNLDIVKFLVKKNANKDALCWFDMNTLHLAAQEGYVDIVEWLLNQGMEVDAKAINGSTALHLAAGGGHVAVVKLLLDRGANINAQNFNKETPLHLAAICRWKDVVELLISKDDVDITLKNHEGQTAKEAAIATMKYLSTLKTPAVEAVSTLEKIVDILDRAIEVYLPDVYMGPKYKITNYNVNELIEIPWGSLVYPLQASSSSDYTTPLILAVRNQNIRDIKKLLNMGANVDIKDCCGNSALHWAAKNGNLEAVKLLLEFANIDEKGESGYTALHFAAQMGNTDVVEWLIGKGANVTLENLDNKTALDLAKESKLEKIVGILQISDIPEYIEKFKAEGMEFYPYDAFAHRKEGIYKQRGWKLHISPKPEFAMKVLRELEPIFKTMKCHFKIVQNLKLYQAMSKNQMGKFITIYPNNDKQAFEIAQKIHEIFEKSKMKEEHFITIEHDFKVYPGVFTRLCHYSDLEDASSRFRVGIPETVFANYLKEIGEYEENYEHPFKDGLFFNGDKMPKNVRQMSAQLIGAKYKATLLPITSQYQIPDFAGFVTISALRPELKKLSNDSAESKLPIDLVDKYVAIARIIYSANDERILLVPSKTCCLREKSVGEIMKNSISQLLQCLHSGSLKINVLSMKKVDKKNISLMEDSKKFLTDLENELPEQRPKYYSGNPSFKLITDWKGNDTDRVVASYRVTNCTATDTPNYQVIAIRRISDTQIELLEIPSDIDLYKPKVTESDEKKQNRIESINKLIAFLKNPSPRVPERIDLKLAKCEPHPLSEPIMLDPIRFLEEAKNGSFVSKATWQLLYTVKNVGRWPQDIQYFIDNGANVNVTDASGFTPLHWAAYRGNEDLVRLLIENHANIEAVNNNSQTALDLAVLSGNKDVIQYLQEHKKDM